jgi:tetratricopeptide (TPR) repeat protein
MRRVDEALSIYDRALRIEPNNLEALRNRANALIVQRKFEEAARDCERLLAIDRDQKYVRGVLAHAKLQCCDWRDFCRNRRRRRKRLAFGTARDFPV